MSCAFTHTTLHITTIGQQIGGTLTNSHTISLFNLQPHILYTINTTTFYNITLHILYLLLSHFIHFHIYYCFTFLTNQQKHITYYNTIFHTFTNYLTLTKSIIIFPNLFSLFRKSDFKNQYFFKGNSLFILQKTQTLSFFQFKREKSFIFFFIFEITLFNK